MSYCIQRLFPTVAETATSDHFSLVLDWPNKLVGSEGGGLREGREREREGERREEGGGGRKKK